MGNLHNTCLKSWFYKGLLVNEQMVSAEEFMEFPAYSAFTDSADVQYRSQHMLVTCFGLFLLY